MKRTLILVSAMWCLTAPILASEPQPVTITVQTDRPGARINPAMWGLFFEDINFGADGGLYAELVKNRSFEFPKASMGWRAVGKVRGIESASTHAATSNPPAGGSAEVRCNIPSECPNDHYLHLTCDSDGGFAVVNEGFRGMGIRADESYRFSAHARAVSGSATLLVELIDSGNNVLASARVPRLAQEWNEVKANLRTRKPEEKARLRVAVMGEGSVDLDMVSLFPAKTWRNRPGGLRSDMVQALADLKPGFLRFPGGCIVEGRYLTNRYQWKTTIGIPAHRQLIINRWNDEFRHRPTPDYYQSFGLGFFEYFQLCEDIGAEPLPILNCGMACQFNSGELAPSNELDEYIQGALDLIEFANGPPSSRWGEIRTAMGHAAPFRMKLLGIGNEQWGPQYIERYEAFAKALKQHHPEIQLISSSGPAPSDDRFKFAWEKLRALNAEIVDEHCYAAPQWFLDNSRRYDDYDRNGPKVFMGEYAAQSVAIASPRNRNTLECALAEAAYMIGMERNADVVRMTSYAPLFGHIDAWQWTPNLIWCDNLRVVRTPNYYVQQLFSVNRGDRVLPTSVKGSGVYANAVRDERVGEVILKIVNPFSNRIPAEIRLDGSRKTAGKAKATVLRGAAPSEENTFEQPDAVAPVIKVVKIESPSFVHVAEPFSMTVLRIKSSVAR